MKILFSMRHLGSYRLYDSVLRRLAARGHEVDVVVSRRDGVEWPASAERLLHECPAVRWHWSDDFAANRWLELATLVRLWLDYLRYFDRPYEQAPKLRVRAEERVPGWIVRATKGWPFRTAGGRRVLARLLRIVERALPLQPDAEAQLEAHRPEAVLLTPLVHLGSPQVEVLRSARARGIPTALCVGSWDHLSSKSVIRDAPDRVLLWNDTQRREALELHGLGADRVVVTGAQCYDHWFDRTPERTRADFCHHVGLPDDRPVLLWVCSALFPGSPIEAQFVLEWIDRVRRNGDPALASAAILVRPHPARLEEWEGVDLSRWDGVALHGALPIDDESREDYFEALYYATAVIGLNTSAFIEAAIVDRPVHALLLPEFQENQEGTVHFHYLLPANGGPLIVARSFEEHEQQLSASLQACPGTGPRNAAFVSSFVRPAGRERAAGDVFVDAVEDLGRLSPVARAAPSWSAPVRAALWPVAALTGAIVARGSGDRTSHELQRLRQKARYRQDKAEAERRQVEMRDRQRREKEAAAGAAREAFVRQREQERREAERQKATARRAKEQHKERHERAKRRAMLKRRIKEKLGLA